VASAQPDLARGISAGRSHRRMRGLGLVPAEAAPPVLGGGRSSGEASAAPSTRASGARERMLARTLLWDGDQGVHGGARGSIGLQKSTSGARSRPIGPGLARRLPAQAGEPGARKCAGSRVAVAKATCARAAIPVAGSHGSHAYPRGAAGACEACVLGGGSTRRWKASWRGACRRL
jgi:hypothetical protein